jgi:hypothetical protein
MARTSIAIDIIATGGAGAIDTNGYGTVSIVCTGAATGVLSLTECDTSDGTFTAVDAGDITGDTAIAASAYNIAGYIGNKQYIKASVTGTGNTFVIILGEPRLAE